MRQLPECKMLCNVTYTSTDDAHKGLVCGERGVLITDWRHAGIELEASC